jgi:segregation and condensation protein A
MSYKIKLEAFEGPLDLLLFLIRKNEVDIYDIPIALITQQYLEYLEIIQSLDLEAASDFILIAATLMRIKSQLLLPKPDVEKDEEDIVDPRQELIERLLEYKRYKDVAVDLAEKEKLALQQYPRGSFKIEDNGFDEEFLNRSEVTLFDLVAAFKKLLDQKKNVPIHRVQEINVTLEERIAYIEEKLLGANKLKFSELFQKSDTKIVLIVTFIALLELIKQGIVQVTQSQPFDELILARN